MKKHYKTLGLEDGASQEEIQTAYERLSKELDPKNNANQEFFIEEYKKVQEAYKALSNSSILATEKGIKATKIGQQETRRKRKSKPKPKPKPKAKKSFFINNKPLIISIIFLVLLKLFFSDKLQNISINYFKINFNELLIILSLIIFYTLFSIKTLRKKVSKTNLIAREILYIFFNIIVGFSFYLSFQYLSNKNLEHNNNKESFLKEINVRTVDGLNNKQVSSAKELGYIIETNKAYFSKWYEILQYKSLTSINGIYKFKKNKINTIKKEQPEIYNSFINFFGQLNEISIDELYSEGQNFSYKEKNANINLLNYDSKDITFDLTLGKYNIEEISAGYSTKRKLKKYYHSYHQKSPYDNSRAPKKFSANNSCKNPYTHHYSYSCSRIPTLTTGVSDFYKSYDYRNHRNGPKYSGVYVWNKKRKKWESFYEIEKDIDCYNRFENPLLKWYPICGAFRKGEEFRDIFYKSGGGILKKINLYNIDYRICQNYNCETSKVLDGYDISVKYNKTEKENLLDLPIVFNSEEISSIKNKFKYIREYGYSNLYTERVISNLLIGFDKDTFYNKKTLFYKYSFLRHLDSYSFNIFETIFKNSVIYNLFWGIFLLIFIIAYIYRIILIGFIWSISIVTD